MLLSRHLQRQQVEIEDPDYASKMGSAETGRYFQRKAFGNALGASAGIEDPDLYITVDRWVPCTNCGEPDPTGLVQKEGDKYGLYKAKGGAEVVKVFPPHLSKAQQALQPPKGPVPVLRTDGIYMAPTSSGFDCLRFYHDDRIAYAPVGTKHPPERAAQDIAKWLRYKGAEKGTLSGKRERHLDVGLRRITYDEDKFYVTFKYETPNYSSGGSSPGSKTFTGTIESNDFIQLDYRVYETGRKGRRMFTFVPAVFKH
jgi:hypothetical protein